MHEGGWEPFVHHFSSVLEDLVQRERRNKGWRDFVHQVGAGRGQRNA